MNKLHVAMLGWVALLLTMANVVPSQAADAPEPGRVIYDEYCSVCHGEQGDGQTRVRRGLNPPPRDFTSPLAKAELTRERMLASVTHGRSGTAMMPFATRLQEDEIVAVVDYITANFIPKEEVPVDAAMVARVEGEHIYVNNCAVCHGDGGNGAMWTKSSLNPPPRDFTSAQSAQELSRERMITSVTFGRPGTAMMSFSNRLAAEEIERVVDYVRGNFLGKAAAAAQSSVANPHQATAAVPLVAADMSLPLPLQLQGDATWGREFYLKNCFTCHGEKGDGQGPRASFNRPAPRNFLAEDSRKVLNRPALFKAIGMGKPGTVMPAWSKVLSDQEIANVAEFVFVTFIHPEQPAVPVADDEKKKVPS